MNRDYYAVYTDTPLNRVICTNKHASIWNIANFVVDAISYTSYSSPRRILLLPNFKKENFMIMKVDVRGSLYTELGYALYKTLCAFVFSDHKAA